MPTTKVESPSVDSNTQATRKSVHSRPKFKSSRSKFEKLIQRNLIRTAISDAFNAATTPNCPWLINTRLEAIDKSLKFL